MFIAAIAKETVQMSTNGEMEKQNGVYPHNIILFSQRKEWSADTCHSIDESSNVMLSENDLHRPQVISEIQREQITSCRGWGTGNRVMLNNSIH